MNIKKIKILIIYNSEKEAQKIDEYLLSLGFTSIYATPYYQLGVKYAAEEKIDLIIINSKLKNNNTIKRVTEKKSLIGLPIIFYTDRIEEYNANINDENLIRNKQTAFLLNPCSDRSLYITIELLCKTKKTDFKLESISLKNSKNKREKISFTDILFIEAGISSCKVYTRWDVYSISGSLPKFTQKLGKQFVKVHEKYTINQNQISQLKQEHIAIENFNIPIAKSSKKQLKKILQNLNKNQL